MTEDSRTVACSSCGAPMIWTDTEGGRRMPVDAKPTKGIVLGFGGRATPSAKVVDVYTSHFATCPNANAHRKPAGDRCTSRDPATDSQCGKVSGHRGDHGAKRTASGVELTTPITWCDQ